MDNVHTITSKYWPKPTFIFITTNNNYIESESFFNDGPKTK